MTQCLKDLITNWELRNGVTVDTMKRAKAGHSIKPVSAYQIAKALGCTDDEAKGYADQATFADIDPETARDTA